MPRFEDVTGRLEALGAGRVVRIGRSDVGAVRTMTDKVTDILDQIGAGHARPVIAAFLVNTADPCLRGAGTDQTVRGTPAHTHTPIGPGIRSNSPPRPQDSPTADYAGPMSCANTSAYRTSTTNPL
ncbi:hypothetical protein ACF1BP_37280 [Streptomyces sp. NPDC014735]|uniref:hypothetical protein n=1 Tax=unclassified Streptomyces TaxID=2593676 RepID=UPI0036FE5D36